MNSAKARAEYRTRYLASSTYAKARRRELRQMLLIVGSVVLLAAVAFNVLLYADCRPIVRVK